MTREGQKEEFCFRIIIIKKKTIGIRTPALHSTKVATTKTETYVTLRAHKKT